MFHVECPNCHVPMHEDLDQYVCDQCGHEIFMGRVLLDRLKAALKSIKQSFGKLSLSELKQRSWDETDPFTAAVIALLAWVVAKNIALPVVVNILRAMALLLGPFGLMLAIVIPIIAYRHKGTINKKATAQKDANMSAAKGKSAKGSNSKPRSKSQSTKKASSAATSKAKTTTKAKTNTRTAKTSSSKKTAAKKSTASNKKSTTATKKSAPSETGTRKPRTAGRSTKKSS